jgi:SAM-dependent methyltransferase
VTYDTFPPADYNEYPKLFARNDFWNQVRRTIDGVPITESEILEITRSIRSQLSLSQDDLLLDLACGNGALASYLFPAIISYHGIDASQYLIEIATEFFAKPPRITFQHSDVATYVLNEQNPERFTKVLCYGSFQYFSQNDAKIVLDTINSRFTNVDLFLIGNLPDRDKAHLFFGPSIPPERILNDPAAKIGIWRTKDQFKTLAREYGWQSTFSTLDPAIFNAKYRYDVVLTRMT